MRYGCTDDKRDHAHGAREHDSAAPVMPKPESESDDAQR